jgi:hypothetical protein
MIPLPLVGGHGVSQSNMAGASETVNMYIEPAPEGGLDMLVSRPGAAVFSDPFTSGSMTSLTRAGAVATATTAANHYLRTGEYVEIVGATGAEYNGVFQITRTGANTFTYAVTGAPASPDPTPPVWKDRNPVRALFTQGRNAAVPQVFAVVGARLYSLSTAGFLTLGPATASTLHFDSIDGPVVITDNGWQNGQQLVFAEGVSGGRTFVWDYNGGAPTFTVLNPPFVTGSNTATFVDGYIVCDDKSNNGRFYYSNLYDATTFNALDFATAEGSVDKLVAVFADRRELYLFGNRTVEIWMNTGDSNNPFQRFQGGFIHAGCLAPASIARVDNSVMWLGASDEGEIGVMRLGGNYQAEVISPTWLNRIFFQANSVNSIFKTVGFVIRIRGHEFYILRLTGDVEDTYVFDALTKKWFRWMNYGATGNFEFTCHCYTGAENAASYANPHLIAGKDPYLTVAYSGRVYGVAAVTPADYSNAIVRYRTMSHIGNKREFLRIKRFELLGENDSSSRTVSLSWSKDGGRTFGTEASVTCTNTGQTKYLWNKLGAAFTWTFRVKSSVGGAVSRWAGAFIEGTDP